MWDQRGLSESFVYGTGIHEVIAFFLNMSDTGKVNVVQSHKVSIL
jgi:hypothetical protein